MVQFASVSGSLPFVQWLSKGRFSGSRASWNSMLFNKVYTSMDDVRSEAYRYELSHIEKILNDRINLNKPSEKRFLVKDKDGRTSIVTLRE